MNRALLILLVVSYLSRSAYGFVEGLYCGTQNCYDVLNVTRDATKTEIARRYRKLASVWHPDRHKTEEGKQKAEIQFRAVATAYETLKDDESRADYDYMIDNPEEMYRHYYYYYRRRYSPKVDIRVVIVVTIVAVSIVQYISAWQKYNEAISYLMAEPKYRMKAVEVAKERGLLGDAIKKGRKKQEKTEIKEREDAVIKQILEENMDIKGGYGKPSVLNLVAIQLIFLPYYAAIWCWFYARWLWKFTICREEYGEEERLYVIRKWLKMSQQQFDSLESREIDEFLDKELWIKKNFTEWKTQKEEQERLKNLEKGSYKRYKRYMKSGGAGQITFLDDE